jgi:hypothetical protein
MSQLLRPDLNQIQLDVDSLLGRAIALGQQYEKLPPRFLETLMTYLRFRGMDFARQRRSGIRLGKEELEKGIRQCLVCVDLALEEKSAGDVNTAVEILATGEFEALRKSGWEKAFARLEEMQAQSALLYKRREAVFIEELCYQIKIWARITPETWSGLDAEGGEVEVDPQQDYIAFREIVDRMDFLRALPREPLRQLLEAQPAGWSFADLLRRLILAVALGRQELTLDQEVLQRFQEQCFADGRWKLQARQLVREQIGSHLEEALESAAIRRLVAAEVDEEIIRLEETSQDDLGTLLLLPEEWNDLETAREMAEGEIEDWRDS